MKARLALGAAKFNLGDVADAQRDWLRVIALDPENVEAYYDLGFLYLSEDPPDMARAKKMWRKVVELAPGSSRRQDGRHAPQGPGESRAPGPRRRTGSEG